MILSESVITFKILFALKFDHGFIFKKRFEEL